MNNETTKEKKPINKKLKYGAIATAITVFFIAIVVFINLIASNLSEQKGLKLDLTEQKIFGISQESLDYAKTIDTDVEIAVMRDKEDLETVTMGNANAGKIISESLMKYQQSSGHITVNFYDMQKNPDRVNKFKENYAGDITEDCIVIASGNRVEVVNIGTFFTIDTEYYYQTGGGVKVTGYRGETEITPALMKVTDANPVNVAIIDYSNQQFIYSPELISSMNYMQTLLEDNGYFCEEVDIFTSEISPEKYDMVILPAPASDLSEDSIKKLEDFMYNGGNLDKDMIYIADYIQRETPNIDAFLEVWGVKVGGNVVIETNEQNEQQVAVIRSSEGKASAGTAPIVAIADEVYSEGLATTRLPIVATASRNIEILFDVNVDRTVSAILKTSDSAVLMPIYGDEAESFNMETAEKSSHVVMALATKSNMDTANVEHKNNLLVISSGSFVDQYIGMTGSYNNIEFFINTVNKVCDKEANNLVIAEKNIASTAVSITSDQLKLMQRTVIFVIPIIVAIFGIVVFIRRRNR